FGPCDHMLENFEHPQRFALWQEAFRRTQRGAPIDWRPLLGGYRAIVDWPGAYFWRELIVAHPDAKVILTVRDPERWYESSLATIFSMHANAETSPRTRLLMKLLGFVFRPLRGALRVATDVIWNGTFDGRFSDKDYAQSVFVEHNREVAATVPAERLLIFEVKQGWQTLCAFLDVPVPEEPFPHVNDADSFRKLSQERFAQSLLTLARPVVAAAAGLAALIVLARRVRRSRQPDVK
ncbi:MAG: hypothetical protein M3Q50_15545, partial [Chloroflexota bacterium]|nr:hypothetical protein [Chloroflexota bacterium]